MKTLIKVILSIATVFSRGFCAVKLWAWFVIPTFSFAPLSMSVALGLMCVVGSLAGNIRPSDFLFHVSYDSKSDKYHQMVISQGIANLMYPWALIFSGWIYTLFM